MKKNRIIIPFIFLLSVVVIAGVINISDPNSEIIPIVITPVKEERRTLSEEAKTYWYDGKAELSSYTLTQARYGETHKGTAVLVYVTEPFSKTANTKADNDYPDNIPILKLNKTLKFNTGIYPYSMMNSSFFPMEHGNYSLKLSSSLQEWCGMTYFEMKNAKKDFIFNFNSYFEGFTYENKVIKKTLLEDDLWSLIRLNPESLPIGEQSIIPTSFFLRLRNKEPKTYKASLSLRKEKELSYYTIEYPELKRTLSIKYRTAFPHQIVGWEDTHYSGYGDEKKIQTSKGELLKTIKTDYWNQNHNKDAHWRKKLAL